MIELNNAIQKMSQTEFGIDFLTGEGTKSPESVEQLKNQSLKREIEAVQRKEQFAEARAKRQWERECNLDEREISISRKEKEVDTKASEVSKHDLELKAKENYLHSLENALNGFKERLDDRDKELQSKEREIALKGKINARLDALEQYVRENPSKIKFASAVNEVKAKAQAISEREVSQQTERSGNLSYT